MARLIWPPFARAPFKTAVVLAALAACGGGDGSPTTPQPLQPEPSGPTVPSPGGTHAYFETLRALAECRYSYSMRSQAELDAIETGGVSAKKLPITYDPAADAALVRIYAPVSTDSQQKLFPIVVSASSMLLTWDFKFDRQFQWLADGYMVRHKTWRLDDPHPWLAVKTDYQHAAQVGRFTEVFVSLPSSGNLAPGSTRGDREILFPRLAEFFMEPDTWTRMWILIEDLSRPICHLSVWMADQTRDAIQVYNRLPLTTPAPGLATFRVEYDTSGDTAINPREAHSWNRNLVVLADMPPGQVPRLLQRPPY